MPGILLPAAAGYAAKMPAAAYRCPLFPVFLSIIAHLGGVFHQNLEKGGGIGNTGNWKRGFGFAKPEKGRNVDFYRFFGIMRFG
jgi:hypothetical protein